MGMKTFTIVFGILATLFASISTINNFTQARNDIDVDASSMIYLNTTLPAHSTASRSLVAKKGKKTPPPKANKGKTPSPDCKQSCKLCKASNDKKKSKECSQCSSCIPSTVGSSPFANIIVSLPKQTPQSFTGGPNSNFISRVKSSVFLRSGMKVRERDITVKINSVQSSGGKSGRRRTLAAADGIVVDYSVGFSITSIVEYTAVKEDGNATEGLYSALSDLEKLMSTLTTLLSNFITSLNDPKQLTTLFPPSEYGKAQIKGSNIGKENAPVKQLQVAINAQFTIIIKTISEGLRAVAPSAPGPLTKDTVGYTDYSLDGDSFSFSDIKVSDFPGTPVETYSVKCVPAGQRCSAVHAGTMVTDIGASYSAKKSGTITGLVPNSQYDCYTIATNLAAESPGVCSNPYRITPKIAAPLPKPDPPVMGAIMFMLKDPVFPEEEYIYKCVVAGKDCRGPNIHDTLCIAGMDQYGFFRYECPVPRSAFVLRGYNLNDDDERYPDITTDIIAFSCSGVLNGLTKGSYDCYNIVRNAVYPEGVCSDPVRYCHWC